jgi:hypothetical protein
MKDETDGTCSMHGELRNACKILVQKSEGNGPCGKPRGTYEDNI